MTLVEHNGQAAEFRYNAGRISVYKNSKMKHAIYFFLCVLAFGGATAGWGASDERSQGNHATLIAFARAVGETEAAVSGRIVDEVKKTAAQQASAAKLFVAFCMQPGGSRDFFVTSTGNVQSDGSLAPGFASKNCVFGAEVRTLQDGAVLKAKYDSSFRLNDASGKKMFKEAMAGVVSLDKAGVYPLRYFEVRSASDEKQMDKFLMVLVWLP